MKHWRQSAVSALTWALASVLGLGSSGCTERDETAQALALFERVAHAHVARSEKTPSAVNPRLLRRFQAARSEIGAPSTKERIELGRMLFFEPRLSKNHDISCNSCHQLDRYGVDGMAFSKGHRGQLGGRNAPTVYHSAALFQQFWDGRAPDVEAQALGPILNPVEMAAPSEAHVLGVLKSMPEYVTAFTRAFPDEPSPVSFKNVGRAIGAFERKLTTHAPWDRYLDGDTSALSAQQTEGLKLFTNLGCMVCHTGELVGGSMFEKVGVVEAWPNQKDQGRFEVTKAEGDRMLFRVPTLRNIAQTAPYFHDSSAATLPEAVSLMGKHQLGLELSPPEIDSIVAWLNALTGPLPQDYIEPPKLPASTPTTPKPNPQ